MTTLVAVNPAVVRALAVPTEPTAAAYLSLQPQSPTTDTGVDLTLRARQLLTELVVQGVDELTEEVLAQYLNSQPAAPATAVAFAREGSLIFAHTLPGMDWPRVQEPDLARFGAPAHILPLLSYLDEHPAYVHIATDRTGADLRAVPYGATSGTSHSVSGPDDEIERNAPGGWAQARYQRRAQDSWSHNAVAVANAASQAIQQVGAHLVFVTGDVRAVQLLQEHLPKSSLAGATIRHLPGARRQDGAGSLREEEMHRAVAEFVEQQRRQLIEDYNAQGRPGGLAVTGAAETLRALTEARVETLIVVDDPRSRRLAWFGPQTLCVADPKEQPGSGMRIAGRLVDVAVRGAVLTDAEVCVLPPGGVLQPRDGLGALCRY